MMDEKQKKLFDWLDDKAFQPVLDKDPDDYSGDKKDKLKDVQSATRSERKRYQNYSSAQDLYNNYQDDLDSEEAKKIDRELDDLDLPKLSDFENEFSKKARELGVDT
jgi:hypothetical protein